MCFCQGQSLEVQRGSVQRSTKQMGQQNRSTKPSRLEGLKVSRAKTFSKTLLDLAWLCFACLLKLETPKKQCIACSRTACSGIKDCPVVIWRIHAIWSPYAIRAPACGGSSAGSLPAGARCVQGVCDQLAAIWSSLWMWMIASTIQQQLETRARGRPPSRLQRQMENHTTCLG